MEVDELFLGPITLNKQKKDNLQRRKNKRNISKLGGVLCLVSKESNMDGFPERLYLQMDPLH